MWGSTRHNCRRNPSKGATSDLDTTTNVDEQRLECRLHVASVSTACQIIQIYGAAIHVEHDDTSLLNVGGISTVPPLAVNPPG